MVNEKPVKQEKKKPAKPKKPKAPQSESSQPVTSVIADAAPKSAVATVPGIPSVKPKRKKPGTAVKRKVQPIAVDPKGKRKGFVSVSFRKDCRPFYELHGCVSPVRESNSVWDVGFHAMDSGLQVLDSSLCQWTLDSGFQSLVVFRIP